MKAIYFLRGLPASGKTTWAKRKLASLNRAGMTRAIRTNKDEIRAQLRAEGVSSESRVIRREAEVVTEALKAGLTVIIDNTHFHPPHELRYKQLAEEHGYRFKIKSFVNVPIEECVRRDLKRSNSVGESVIRNMYYKYLDGEPKVPPNDPAPPVLTSALKLTKATTTAHERTSNKTMATKKAQIPTTVIVEQASTVELTKIGANNSLSIKVRRGNVLLGTLTMGRGSVEWRPKKVTVNYLKKTWTEFAALLDREMKN
jgi:predicted kinase